MNPALDYATFYQWRSLSNTSLIHINPNGSLGPGLATSWHFVNGPGQTPNSDFVFTLRHNVKFSDGSPVTAQAVATWLNYFAKQPGLYQPQMGPIASITATGKWTVEIRLKASNTLVPYLLSEAANWGAVESPYAVAHPKAMASATFGAGPYKLDQGATVANSSYTFVPNPYYYDKAGVKWSKVVIKIISDPSSLLDAIKTGQVQVAAGDITTAPTAASAGLRVVTVSNGDGGLLFYNRNQSSSNPVGNALVRQALNYAVDRPAICKALYGQYASPATSGMPATDASLPAGSTTPYSYDPAKAKALLAQAGYSGGFTVKVLAYGALGIDGTEMPQAIAKYLQAVGVNLNITTVSDASTYVADNATKQFPIESNTLGLRPLEQDYQFVFPPNGALNPFKSDDPTLDGLYTKALAAASPSAYSSYMDQMVQRITTQAYSLNVCTKPRLWYVSKSVGGVSVNGLSTAPLASEMVPNP
jgi:peptide/nickel transport system substrate-binding protein